MAINLLNIQPHKVSRDLGGYITFIYGAPKTGKTTLATQMPKALLLAFEKGYNALPGVFAQDVTTWGEMKQIYRELKKPEVQEAYKSIIIDTVDIAADLCQKYICTQLGIENIGDGGWTNNGWAKYKKEFEEVFRGLTMMGYAVVFISHATRSPLKDAAGKEVGEEIKPSIQSSALKIIENMADIYGYAFATTDEHGNTAMKLMLRSPANSGISCGSRFKNMAPVIDFNYEALAQALTDAIDSEAKEHNNEFVTNEREMTNIIKEYDYDELLKKFTSYADTLMTKNSDLYGPKITQIIEKYFGKGKKINNATRDQAELIYLVVNDIEEDLMK